MKQIDYTFEECRAECDNCGHEEIIETTDFRTANEELKDYGWIIRKIDNEWHEFCELECYKQFLRGIRR